MISEIPYQWRPISASIASTTVEEILVEVLQHHSIRPRVQYLNLVTPKLISPAHLEILKSLTDLRELRVSCTYPYNLIPV